MSGYRAYPPFLKNHGVDSLTAKLCHMVASSRGRFLVFGWLDDISVMNPGQTRAKTVDLCVLAAVKTW
jgi:hypothetical protein